MLWARGIHFSAHLFVLRARIINRVEREHHSRWTGSIDPDFAECRSRNFRTDEMEFFFLCLTQRSSLIISLIA